MSESSFEGDFRAAFTTRFPELIRYLYRLSGDAALASDIAQETFVRLYQRGEMPGDARAWLVTVAHNLFRDERRRAGRRRHLLAQRDPAHTMGDEPPAPDAALECDERRQAVQAALNQLSERDRRLLLLRHEGYSYRELAAALSLVDASVGTLLARARSTFRRALEELQ
jgi:RNA polymerase sigma factor (sigma-70 family)